MAQEAKQKATAAAQPERCWNCGREIAAGETPHVFESHVVCHTCDGQLRNPDPAALDPVPRCPLCREAMVSKGEAGYVFNLLFRVPVAAAGLLCMAPGVAVFVDQMMTRVENYRLSELANQPIPLSLPLPLEAYLLCITGLLYWILVAVTALSDPRRLQCPRCGASWPRR